MKPKPISEQDLKLIKERLIYNKLTGEFTWAKQLQKYKQGDIAGHVANNGYLTIQINNRNFFAHRLAWLFVHGEMPNSEIDHINRIKTDNRIDNLRIASRELNQNNIGLRVNNKTGVTGVQQFKNKFYAVISIFGKRKFLGSFNDLESAKQARLEAENKYHLEIATQRH